MAEFLEANGSWLVLGLLFVLMLRMHLAGACGTGRHESKAGAPTDDDPAASSGGARAREPAGGCH